MCVCVSQRWLLLTDVERTVSLRGNVVQLLRTVNDLLPCLGCRNSTEALFYKLSDAAQANAASAHHHRQSSALVPLPPVVSRSGIVLDAHDDNFSLSDAYLANSDACLSLFLHQERWANSSLAKSMAMTAKGGSKGAVSSTRARCLLHSQRARGRPRPAAFEALWRKLPEEHQRHLAHIDSDQFLTDLEAYLRRHRFCCRCKEKVLEAYDLLLGSSCSEDDCEDCGFDCLDKHHDQPLLHPGDYGDDLHFTSYLFDELAYSRATNQIIVPCNLEFLSQLMARADQEVVGDWGDRHARTISEAQDEVLICLGMVIWDKLQALWTKSRAEQRAEELLVHCAVSTLRRNFDVAVEALHGKEMMELLLAEEDDESRRLAKKKEKRKEKKKKRKTATKLKQQSERSESEKSFDMSSSKQAAKKTKQRPGSNGKLAASGATTPTKSRASSHEPSVASPSPTNSISSQGDDDDNDDDDDDVENNRGTNNQRESSGARHQNALGFTKHQCTSSCDEPCLFSSLSFDEHMEWRLLSSMGWDPSSQYNSANPELDVDTDDEHHGIPEDEIRFWKQNHSTMARRRLAQRQKLQERFDEFVLRTNAA